MANTQLYLILFTVLNIFHSSNAQYVGTPKTSAVLRAAHKKTLELKCEYVSTDGDGQFIGWYKDDVPITDDKPDHYVVKSTSNELKLNITFLEEDREVKKWSVKTNKVGQEEPTECQFNQIFLRPSPQRIETDRATEKLDAERTTVRRLQDQSVTLKCIIEPTQTNQVRGRRVRWEFSTNGDKYSKLPADVRNTSNNEIIIDRIKKTHRGYYRCLLNEGSYTVFLRVKDPYAALWPFIVIVGTVSIFVIIILIYEKRQRLARKAAAAAAEDEGNDNANDPLVRSTNKLSDNENKKRTVKA